MTTEPHRPRIPPRPSFPPPAAPPRPAPSPAPSVRDAGTPPAASLAPSGSWAASGTSGSGPAGAAPAAPPHPAPSGPGVLAHAGTLADPAPSEDLRRAGGRPGPAGDARATAPAVDREPAPAGEAEGRAPAPRGAGQADPAPWTDGAAPPAFAPPRHWARDDEESPAGRTTRPRPPGSRSPARIAAIALCAVLGAGLLGGAAAGSLLAVDTPAAVTPESRFQDARTAWHSTPVDTLFPRTLKGRGAGPGGADRAWTRVAVAPDGPCADALDPLLLTALGPVGCARLLRATYTDATTSSVTTVGLVFTQGDRAATSALRTRFVREKLAERADLMPRTFPVPKTVAAGFGDAQRASWTVRVLGDAPVVVYAVSGFADGRAVPDPRPAPLATADGATSAPAQSGLGHEAKGIADRIERGLRTTVEKPTETPG